MTGLEQPKNDALPAKIRRLPGVRSIPYVGMSSPQRAQSLINYQLPLANQDALLKDNDSVVAAIRIYPANLSTSDPDEWANRVESLASVLGSAVSGNIEWYNPVKAVDYSDRRDEYATAESAFRGSNSVEAMSDVLADLAEERAAVVHQYQETTTVREYYVLVEVNKKESVFDTEESGGFSSVKGLDRALLEWELYKMDDKNSETLAASLSTLDSRVKSLNDALGQIEGISSTRVSTADLAQICANYYRSENMYGFKDGQFKDIVRQSPIAESAGDTGDELSDVSYSHITNTTYNGEDVEEDEDDEEDDSQSLIASRMNMDVIPEEPRNSGQMDLAFDDDELSDMFKSLLAPEEFAKRSPTEVQLDRKKYTATLVIRDWPSNPRHGMMESVLNYSAPGVESYITTPIESVDDQKAMDELSELIRILEHKIKKYEKSRVVPVELVNRYKAQRDEANEILNTLRETEYGLFDSNTYVQVRSESKTDLNDAVSAIKNRLRDVGATAKRLTHENQVKGFQAAAPTVSDDGAESKKMLGDGIASLFSWSSHNLWEKGGVSIGLHKDRSEPTVFDMWARNAGYSIGVFGNVGSGKTTTTKRLLLRQKLMNDWEALARPDMTSDETLMVAIDPLQEFAGLCQLFGGERIVIGGDTHINPLYYEEVSEEKQDVIGENTARMDAERRAMSFIESYYQQQDIPLGESGKRGVWEKCLGIVYDEHGSGDESPTLGHVLDVIRDIVSNAEEYVDREIDEGSGKDDAAGDLRETAIDIINNDVEAFKEDGMFHNLTQQTDVKLSDEDFVYLDLQRYEQERDTAALYMQLLMDQVYEQAKSRDGKTVLAMDEAHYLLNNTANQESLKQITLHHRHHELSLIFSTQAMGEFFSSSGGLTSSGEIIFDNLATRIYHFTNEITDEWAEELELSNAEHDFISNARTGSSGCAEALLQIKQEGTYPIQVDMANNMNPREFAITEFDPTDHGESLREYIRNYTDSQGNDVCEWTWDQ